MGVTMTARRVGRGEALAAVGTLALCPPYVIGVASGGMDPGIKSGHDGLCRARIGKPHSPFVLALSRVSRSSPARSTMG